MRHLSYCIFLGRLLDLQFLLQSLLTSKTRWFLQICPFLCIYIYYFLLYHGGYTTWHRFFQTSTSTFVPFPTRFFFKDKPPLPTLVVFKRPAHLLQVRSMRKVLDESGRSMVRSVASWERRWPMLAKHEDVWHMSSLPCQCWRRWGVLRIWIFLGGKNDGCLGVYIFV